MKKANDDTLMPFGKHRGKKLGLCPASYLLWFGDQAGSSFQDIRDYIEEKREQLEREAEDEGDY